MTMCSLRRGDMTRYGPPALRPKGRVFGLGWRTKRTAGVATQQPGQDRPASTSFLGELVRYLCFLTAVLLWGLTAWLVMP